MHRDALARSRALAATLCASCVLDNWRPPLDAADVAGETAIVDATPTCQEPAVRALAAGFHGFACVVRCAGDVWCWGRNDRGQLGDGTSARRATPVRVQGVTDGSSLSAGFGHACVGAAGGAWCWGENMAGALGNNTRDGSPRAVTVQGLPGPVASVAAGGLHSCVVLATGEVSCWGDASRGQLGDGSRTGRTTPRGVLDLGGPAAAVVAGQFHTCARLRSGEVSCWGQNTFGTLADGTFDDRTTPTTVPLSAPATDLVTTNNHVCAVVEGGAVWCWGYNDEGQLGDGTRTTRARPVQVRGLPGLVRRGATGSLHTCALLGDGSVWCWGANERGQLGDGGSARRLTPVPVQGLGGVAVALAAGDAVTCAGLQDGRVMCWGANDEGQLGDGSLVDQPRPVAVALPR